MAINKVALLSQYKVLIWILDRYLEWYNRFVPL